MARSGLKEAMAGGRALGPVGHAVLVAGPVVAAALLYVWTQSTTVTLGYALSKAAAEQQKLLRTNSSLNLAVATRRNQSSLRDAGRELGLAPPNSQQIVRVRVP